MAINPNYKIFLDWEIKARDAVARHFPKRTLVQEAQDQWRHKLRQREYAAAILALEKSLQDAKKRDKEIFILPKRFGRRGLTRTEAHRRRWRSLVESRKAWGSVSRNIVDLEDEQLEQDIAGRVIANRRTQDFTAQLATEAQNRVTTVIQDIAECRTARAGLGDPVSEDSEDSDTDSEEVSTDEEDEDEEGEEDDDDDVENEREGDVEDEDETNVEEPYGEQDEAVHDRTEADNTYPEGGAPLDPEKPSRGDEEGREDSSLSKRKSVQVHDAGGQAKRRRTSSLRDAPVRVPDRSGSAQPGASEHEKDVMPPREVESQPAPPVKAGTKPDSTSMKLKDLLNAWDKLEKVATKAEQASDRWAVDFIHWRTWARKILESEGWAIVPELEEDSDVMKVLEDVGKKVAKAAKEMDVRVKRRDFLRKDKLKSTRDVIGFGGPRGNRPIEGEWAFQKKLGEGCWGMASLWVQYDVSGNIVERVAIKDEYVKESSWKAPRTFYGDVQDRQPREAYMHNLISNRDPEALHIVKFLASALFMEEKLFRIYMEYCELGEVWETWVKMITTRKEGDQFLSTPALWALFECLAKAAHLMTFGCFPHEAEPAGWEPMIHRDIKPDNVFMSEPDKARWRGLPRLKLADFGLAVLESEPILQTDRAGAVGFIPPEIYNPEKRPPELKVSSPADIWTIGVVMVELINLDVGKNFTFDMDESKLPRVKKAGRAYYPESLIDLIHACVQRLPGDRIGVKDLCDRIEQEGKELCLAELSEENASRFPWQSAVADKMAKRSRSR